MFERHQELGAGVAHHGKERVRLDVSPISRHGQALRVYYGLGIVHEVVCLKGCIQYGKPRVIIDIEIFEDCRFKLACFIRQSFHWSTFGIEDKTSFRGHEGAWKVYKWEPEPFALPPGMSLY